MPFMIIVIISMIMLYTFPQIGLWLPTQALSLTPCARSGGMTMLLLISGIAVFVVTGGVFWALLPRGGQAAPLGRYRIRALYQRRDLRRRGLGFTMTLSGMLNLLGT